MLSKQQVQHIANLARIRLNDQEVKNYSQELSSILDYVGQLGEVDTSAIFPLSQVAGLENVSKKDSPLQDQCLSQEQALQNAPAKENGFFKVKSVF